MTHSDFKPAEFCEASILAEAIPQENADGLRYLDKRLIKGTEADTVNEAMRFILRNTREITTVQKDGKTVTACEYPCETIKTVIEQLLHSTFEKEGQLLLQIRSNSLELSAPTNQITAHELELLKESFASQGIKPPVFNSENRRVRIVFKNEPFSLKRKGRKKQQLNERGLTELQEKILTFCEEPKAINEIALKFDYSPFHLKDKIIAPVINAGYLSEIHLGLSVRKGCKYVRSDQVSASENDSPDTEKAGSE